MTKCWPLAFILLSCSSTSWHQNAHIQKISVSSKKEALAVISNKLQFLKLTFENTKDSYYGQPRWSKQCLEQNIVGEIIDDGHTFISVSTLVLDENNKAGHCLSTNASFHQARVIHLYCGKDEVLIISAPLQPKNSWKSSYLCQ